MPITASMLYNYTSCPHRVTLDLFGDPADRDEVSPFVELLWERGHAFEQETIAALRMPFLDLRDVPLDEREGKTLLAMEQGERLIYGGRISHGRLLGEPDLLRRAKLGYVPGDIKSGVGLAGTSEEADGRPKRHYAVQLALYLDILRQIGAAESKDAFVWDIRGEEVPYDLAKSRGPRTQATMWEEYSDVLASVEDIADQHVVTRPGLISACSLCHWRSHCRREINTADDLTLISELGTSTRAKFAPGIATVSDLARVGVSDLIVGGKSTISGVGGKTLRKLHDRAVLRKQENPKPYFTEEILLPASHTEIFFDIETDPFRDLCYLHGFLKRVGGDESTERYVAFFAEEAVPEDEERAFAEAWAYVKEHRDAVVYYYSHYERTIWKQLARRYPDVAAEDDVIALFEEDRFVDLYSDVVKSRMIWPTASLSLKELAKFVGFAWRDTDPSGAGSIEWFHRWVETGDASFRQRILEYNEDDCRATRVVLDRAVRVSSIPEPAYSRNQIDKAGSVLVDSGANREEHGQAILVAERWREAHAYPTRAFYEAIRLLLGKHPAAANVSHRLKRMPTIIEKLRRNPTMRLTSMQDIGGVRVILPTADDVDRLVEELQEGMALGHELIRVKNYIAEPRDEDGYRSVHLVYRFRDRRFRVHNGLRIELQIRTRLQHNWASAVESMGTHLGQMLKFRQGDKEWLDFFALVSCAFALEERTPPVPRFSSLGRIGVVEALANADQHLRALEGMRDLYVVAEAVTRASARSEEASDYYLLELDSLRHSVKVTTFDSGLQQEALEAYAQAEEEAEEGSQVQPVLVTAVQVREAYASFFLNVDEFAREVARILSAA